MELFDLLMSRRRGGGNHIHVNGLTAATNVRLKNNIHSGSRRVDLTGDTLTGKLLKGQILVFDGKKYTLTEDTYPAAANVIIDAKVTPKPDYDIPKDTPVQIYDGVEYV
ncbi:MAG: hypothetical protein J6S14_19350 [Clostridia bacterium]|nr:hypothetical protein [Clostridia bacterium]